MRAAKGDDGEAIWATLFQCYAWWEVEEAKSITSMRKVVNVQYTFGRYYSRFYIFLPMGERKAVYPTSSCWEDIYTNNCVF